MRLRQWRARLTRADDKGLTLPELLITIVILGIIMVPLGNAMFSFVRFTDQTNQRFNESHDVQLLAGYFARDVQQVGVHDWSGPYPYPLKPSVELDELPLGGLYPCGTAATPRAVVRLAWDDPASTSGEVLRVSYVVVTSGAEQQLRRLTCDDAGTVDADIVVAHNIVTATATAGGSAEPGQVNLSLSIRDPRSTGVALDVVLSGQRRQT